jgi:hypothetical protein
VAEWPIVPDSKSGVPQGTVGSNPTLSAKSPYQGAFFWPEILLKTSKFPVKTAFTKEFRSRLLAWNLIWSRNFMRRRMWG